ncbi:hypothetical protein [Amycolatopsis japonica]|uniref:hypothetical protein n=1 Tax=Amycolatopsis japonica TaxID=208439 RepID=UPI00340F29D3
MHRLGLRFRLHRAVAPRCTPDFVLPRYRLAVFVDGCFWHGCPAHSPAQFRGPNGGNGNWRPTANATDETTRLRRRRAGRYSGYGSVRSVGTLLLPLIGYWRRRAAKARAG